MKLLMCGRCQDVFKLQLELRACACGRTRGRYLDDLNAEYAGDAALPIGFDNPSLVYAVHHRPTTGDGLEFTAFVVPRACETFRSRPVAIAKAAAGPRAPPESSEIGA